jgi:hypothetical protein
MTESPNGLYDSTVTYELAGMYRRPEFLAFLKHELGIIARLKVPGFQTIEQLCTKGFIINMAFILEMALRNVPLDISGRRSAVNVLEDYVMVSSGCFN